MRRVLIVCYGNTLRSDDGVAWHVGEALMARAGPDVTVLLRHQLTPDLAADLSECELVVFVDARVVDAHNLAAGVEQRPVTPDSGPLDTHRLTPDALLGLTQELFDVRPAAYLITIPAWSFELGESLSARTAGLVAEACDRVWSLLAERP
jgi:hydrogenase maturation protease